jgi:hypothetical protein
MKIGQVDSIANVVTPNKVKKQVLGRKAVSTCLYSSALNENSDEALALFFGGGGGGPYTARARAHPAPPPPRSGRAPGPNAPGRHQIESPKRGPKKSAQGRLPQSDLPQWTSKYELS